MTTEPAADQAELQESHVHASRSREHGFPAPSRQAADLGGQEATSAAELADRQAALVAALVAGGPMPAGFDAGRLAATRRALLRKRAGEAAKVWPLLAASLGPSWQSRFAAHVDGRDRLGALREGWDLARILRASGELSEGAARELAECEAAMRYDGATDPRPRAGLRRLLSRAVRRH